MEWYLILLIVLGALVAAAACFAAGVLYRKKVAEREIGSAETEATRLINEAIRAGENRKKEMLLEAKDEIHKSRTEYEKEVKERRAELSKQERRLEQKESTLDKKTEAYERKEEELNRRLQKVTETQNQAEAIRQQQLEKLEEISNSFPGVEKSFAIQSGREVRIMVKPEDISDEGTYVLAREIAKRIENELEYPGQIKVNVIRETRCTEFAK